MKTLIESCIICLFISFYLPAKGQLKTDSLAFFQADDHYNKTRFYSALGMASGTYAYFSYNLYNTWYSQFEQESFHFFNDWNEWENIDKYGHLYTSYFQGVLCYKGAKWTGLDDDDAILTGILCASLFQSTIEVMDGFSSEWGFSMSDMLFNAVGISAFALQQKYWEEQRILFKVSSWPKSYESTEIISSDGTTRTNLKTRADDLFGDNYFERFLKDYNAQTIWASVNVHSFLAEGNQWPPWLNLAFGYSADNMFGGYSNSWEEDGKQYSLDDSYNRYQQFVLAADIDLDKIKTNNHFLRSMLSVLNIFKVPSPAIEINSRGEINFHLVFTN